MVHSGVVMVPSASGVAPGACREEGLNTTSQTPCS
jgi:hypothetical protein